VHLLPPCWSTLYELSQLKEDVLKAALDDGRVRPGMQRKEAIALKPKKAASPKASSTDNSPSELGTAWTAASEEQRSEFLDKLGHGGLCAAMSIDLRCELRDHVISLTFAGSSQSSSFAVYATDKLHTALRCAEQPNQENTRLMIAALGCIIKKADTKRVAHSNIVIAESKSKSWTR
jgi:hypothetical protein